MRKARGNFSKLLVLLMLAFGLLVNYRPSVVFIDIPNGHLSHHSLTGDWVKALMGNSGRHWTKYSQRESNRQAYANIRRSGYKPESGLGNYITSDRPIDLKHLYVRSGGVS